MRLIILGWAVVLLCKSVANGASDEPLRLGVYATAGDVLKYAATEASRAQVLRALEPLHVTHLFLEGRRGSEFLPADTLKKARDFFEPHGIECSGGIATVPGVGFGTRQNSSLGWLNWEDPRTQKDVSKYFTENAPLFRELIVDDFFCTADTGVVSEAARGQRSWEEYRQDLLVSLIDPIMRRPAQEANPAIHLIIKFPQWYDRFERFGYTPGRMASAFDQVWVGTEVRNPKTRRMGFVQPTEGYVNFRWLSSIAGEKVMGGWFDHIECSAQNFVDQAFQSVLAGARELTLFRLDDLMQRHPGDAELAQRLPELFELAGKVQGRARKGVVCYKPGGSNANENLYLMDYLAMIGLPILPQADYPADTALIVLPVQAAADPNLMTKMRQTLARGGNLVLTPALVRQLGAPGGELAGVALATNALPATATALASEKESLPIPVPLEVDGALRVTTAQAVLNVKTGGQTVPLLTFAKPGSGSVFVLNVRTFSERDFHQENEWLLAPKPLGWSELPQGVADRIRQLLLEPVGVRFEAPSGVGLYLFQQGCCLYNFRDQPAATRLEGKQINLAANQCLWLNTP